MSQTNIVEIQSPLTWFSKSKTRAPRFSIPLVKRGRLLSMLDSALDKPVSCVVAPAGFGKSTLLSQWRESLIARDICCAWINLDENDREIRQFFAYLVFAFEDANISLSYLKRAAEGGFVDMSSATIATRLLSAIIAIDEHMVLILDDYHRTASDEIDDFVKVLSEECSNKVHIAIGSRYPVNIDLPALLVAGQAIEIPSFELRFSDREVNEAMGTELDQEAIDVLQGQVEGWPVAVQMTRLLSNNDHFDLRTRRDITGSRGLVAEYLVANVLQSQPEALRKLLLETSILERFNTELADAVCDHDVSQSLIRQLDALQALVVPLDDDLEWFRYHHLFSECMSDVLKQQDPENFIALHRRAAKWCSENRLVAEAVNYANAIRDHELSRQIINNNCDWIRLTYFGGAGYFNGLLANIPEEVILSDPRLLYSKVYTCVLTGNYKQALHYHNAAERLMERDGVTPETLRHRLTTGTGLLCRTEFEPSRDGGWLKDRLKLAEEFMGVTPEKDPRPVTLCCLALQSLFYGEFAEARDYTQQAEKGFGNVVALFCQINFGIIELWTNAPDKARRRFEDTAHGAIQMSGDESNIKFICQTFVAAIDYWHRGLDTEPDHELEQLILRTTDCDGGYEVYNVGFDAVLHDALSRKDYEKADMLIGKLEHAASRFAMQRLTQFAQHSRLDCAVGRESFSEAAQIFEKVKKWLDVDDKALDNLGWRHKTTAFYSCARYLGAIDRCEEALAHVERGLQEADRLDVVLIRVRGNILKASLLERAQRRTEALVTLAHAIEDAVRINCPRPFAYDVSPDLLREAATKAGDRIDTPATANFIKKLTLPSIRDLFTIREKQVLQGLASGKSNKEIAREFDLTENTIKFHLRNVFRKLGVTKRVSAVAKADALGLLP